MGLISPGYVHATHPDTQEPVTFVPGEAMPDWVHPRGLVLLSIRDREYEYQPVEDEAEPLPPLEVVVPEDEEDDE